MTTLSWLTRRLAKLPRPISHVSIETDLPAKMPDGVVLLADRYYADGDPCAPIVLIRTPYGRGGPSRLFGRIFAEQGYQCVVQSTRGTFGSGGEFRPFVHEAEDGEATFEWLSEQPWFVPKVAMWGPSYLGYTQWSSAVAAPEYLRALCLQVTASTLRGAWYPADVFALDTALTWVHSVHYQERPRRWLHTIRQNQAVIPALSTVPLDQADVKAVGEKVAFYQEYVAHPEPDAQIWRDMDRGAATASLPPSVLIAGWYDVFIVDQIADYQRLVAAGRHPRLVVGPWKHTSPGGFTTGMRETFRLFDAQLRDRAPQPGSDVRVFLMGTNRWVDLPTWPPPATPTTFYLRAGGELGTTKPGDDQPDSYVYDPSDPTPSVGGNLLSSRAGCHDNRALEARADVLTYTTAVLESEVIVAGTAVADLYVQSSVAHTDFFVRLCDVCPKGQSINICDGIIRLDGSDVLEGTHVRVDLSPTAYVFRRGHRIRLQVSSGAHPHWARNLGTGEPIATGTRMVSAHQDVFHRPDRLSAVTVPVWTGA